MVDAVKVSFTNVVAWQNLVAPCHTILTYVGLQTILLRGVCGACSTVNTSLFSRWITVLSLVVLCQTIFLEVLGSVPLIY